MARTRKQTQVSDQVVEEAAPEVASNTPAEPIPETPSVVEETVLVGDEQLVFRIQ